LTHGERIILAKGGAGGKGNKSTIVGREGKAGGKGEEARFLLILKLLADIGLVGLPNVGKSTLLACLTQAKP
jgi:GTPase